MAGVALTDWKEQIRDPKIECMSRDCLLYTSDAADE